MNFRRILENTLTQIGKNNSPIIAVIGIAVAKGIFRPLITMMDKKESQETKKYTAIREGLTELIAIPVYWTSGKGAQKLASFIAKPDFFMDKDIYEQYKQGIRNEKINLAYKDAQKLVQENLPRLKTNLTFVGVCAAALLFIPSICSATINPVMKLLKKNSQNKQNISFQTLCKNGYCFSNNTPVLNKFSRVFDKNSGGLRI